MCSGTLNQQVGYNHAIFIDVTAMYHPSDGRGDWNTDGCDLSTFNQSNNVVGCACEHLTNFACLVVCDYRIYNMTILPHSYIF